MPYSRLLQKIINKTNYNNTEIAEKCRELGVNVDRTYINKLFNGKSKPPKDEISRAIAKVCNADERLLVLEGYLDKAPKEVMEMLKHMQLLDQLYVSGVYDNFSKMGKEELQKQLEEYKIELNKKPIADFILDVLNKKDFDVSFYTSSISLSYNENNVNLSLSTPVALPIQDNAMNPIIPEKSHINLTLKNKYENGDIIAFKIKDDDNLYVRYLFYNDDKIMFTALNTEFKPIICNKNDIIILGKVSKVIYDI